MNLLRCRTLLALALTVLFCLAGDSFAQVKQPQPQPKLNQADAEAALGLGIGVMVCMGVVGIAGFALWIWAIFYVLKDAKRRGMDPTIWVILVVVITWLGFVIYLCVREPIKTGSGRKSRVEDDDEEEDRPKRRPRDDDDEEDGGDDVVRRPRR